MSCQWRSSEIHTLLFPITANGNMTATHVLQVGPTLVAYLKGGKLDSHRKHINDSNIFFTFIRCTYSRICDVCHKSFRISLQLNDLLHTPQVHGHFSHNMRWYPCIILIHTALTIQTLLKWFFA